MKGTTSVVVCAIVVIVAISGILRYQQNKESEQYGQLYIGITDATADISNVNDVQMNINKVEIHSATQGWVTISSADKPYELMQLHAQGKTQLYTNATAVADTYDKVRVTVGDVIVKTKNQGNVKATTPSSYIVINSTVNVRDNADSVVKIDVMADKSLHATTDGKYVFAAVVAGESRSGTTVSVAGDDSLSVSGGSVDSSVMVGVDLDGISKANFQLHTDSTLKIDSGLGGVKFMLGNKTYTESDSASAGTESQEDTEASTETDTVIHANGSVQGEGSSVNGNIDINARGGVKVE